MSAEPKHHLQSIGCYLALEDVYAKVELERDAESMTRTDAE